MRTHLLAIFLYCAGCIAACAVNPYLPLWEHIPDGEPYVFDDPDNPGHKRVYIYGSHDSLVDAYCGRELVAWSADVDSLDNWRYDGVIFASTTDANGDILNPGGIGDVLYAPDIALRVNADGTKTYFLYPNNQHGGRNVMVAASSRPDGPFHVTNWDPENPKACIGSLYFDPAVFVDDDGRVYGYWGFCKSMAAELDPIDMASVKEGTTIIEDMVSSRDQDGVFRFFEASSIRKIEGKYVFVYSRVTADGEFGLPSTNYTLAYAYSDNPLGPWTYGGTIIDGRGRHTQPDGSVIVTATPSGNTHGGICEINGQWYVFYHRQSGLDEFSRQAMVAPIDVTVEPDPGGRVIITEGEYTSEGFHTSGLPLEGTYPAAIACYYTGPIPAEHHWPENSYSGPYIQATRYEGNPAWAPSDIALRSNPMVHITDGSVIGYKYFDFGTAKADSQTMRVELKPLGISGNVRIMAGKPSCEEGGVLLGEFSVGADEPKEPTVKEVILTGLTGLHGKHALYLVFDTESRFQSLCDLYFLSF